MTKPVMILDQHFRTVEELFSPATWRALTEQVEIVGGQNWPMPRDRLEAHLPDAAFLVAGHPVLAAADLARAPQLRAVIEVSGTFRAGLDFADCARRGIEVLSCAPGFQRAVAEMTLGLMIAGARGIVEEHERFRTGHERWLEDRPLTDFSLFGAEVGFVGYGTMARAITRLLQPFAPKLSAYDPWLSAPPEGVQLVGLEAVADRAQCLVVAAAPTAENRGLISRDLIARLRPGALVVVISRAHLVDFDALVEAAEAGRIRLASDVFPQEPLPHRAAARQAPNVIWSPHRAAAVAGGRHMIGEMILDDVSAILRGDTARRLQAADPARLAEVLAVPDVVAGVETAPAQEP